MQELLIKNILVPIDFSETSLNAMDTAVAMAKRQGARLTLFHVVNQNLMMYGPYDMFPVNLPSFDIFRNESEEMLAKLADKAREENHIDIQTAVSFGLAASEICKAAIRHEADLVVMGTHGTSGVREFFIGTNAYEVVKHASCPVLTVPPGGKRDHFSKIIFPVRDTTNPLEKYDFLRKIIRKNHATLLVLGLSSKDEAGKMQSLDEYVRQLETQLFRDEVRAVTNITQSSQAAQEVLDMAVQEKADLIAITASLDYDIRDFFIGPYTQQIVNHSKIPVLSIRPNVPLQNTDDLVQKMKDDYGSALPVTGMAYPHVIMPFH